MPPTVRSQRGALSPGEAPALQERVGAGLKVELDLEELEAELRDNVMDEFFMPEAQFKPLMHVVEVLAAETVAEVPQGDDDGGGGGFSASAAPTASPGHGGGGTRSRRSGNISGPSAADAGSSCWLSLRTLAGKDLPLPGIAHASSTVGDVFAAAQRRYSVECTGAEGAAGLYCEGQALVDDRTRLRDLPRLPPPPRRAHLVLQNACYEALCRQVAVVDGVVGAFLGAHYGALSSSVHAVGHVSAEFEALRGRVGALRRQVDDTTQLLTVDMQEQPVREMHMKKRESAHLLALLGTLKTVRDAPGAIDALLERRCFVGAVAHFAAVKELMFTEEMVPVGTRSTAARAASST